MQNGRVGIWVHLLSLFFCNDSVTVPLLMHLFNIVCMYARVHVFLCVCMYGM